MAVDYVNTHTFWYVFFSWDHDYDVVVVFVVVL